MSEGESTRTQEAIATVNVSNPGHGGLTRRGAR